MTAEGEGAAQTAVPTLVVDPNVFISAAISGRGPTLELLRAASAGTVTLVVSPSLISELRHVLGRPKFHRWISEEDAEAFVDAIELMATNVDDPPTEALAPVTRDPNDDYLIYLAEEVGATFLVSGDKDLLECGRPGLAIRTPAETVELLSYVHPWGALVPGRPSEVMPQAEAEGHAAVLRTALGFLRVLHEPDAAELLPMIVTPESLHDWLRRRHEVAAALSDCGMTSRAEYPAPEVAFVKLPPNPGDDVRAISDVQLPAGTKILILQRRPELDGIPDLGGWRVHALTDGIPSDDDVAALHRFADPPR